MTDFAKYEGLVVDPDQELWGQSYYYNAYDPVARIGVLIRIGMLPNRKQANSWLIAFADGLPVFARTNLNLPYTDARPAGGLELAGLTVRAVEPLMLTHISFGNADFALELDWRSDVSMADCIALTQDAEGTFAREMASVHLEGPSVVTGHLSIRGERVALTGTGFRDIAAGVRNWDSLGHYRLAWPIFDNGMAFSGIHGVSTTGANSYMRMFYDGARWLRVNAIKDTIDYAPDSFSVTSMQWAFNDELGRHFTFSATPLFTWLFPQDTFVVCEQIMEFQLDDGTIGYGLSEGGFRLPWRRE
ncbi:hypothetical protein MNAB215_2829 [Mycobacterium numidiamassiliense]|uniref:Uncharacterized protein n=1 Tax=Mycobacterium numidiamassiliense TaxID=1841861 RepID=A0A2U3PA37_9MYCO|nr:hypothetical protein [Mycobacterium numidiamassiliense]SPM40628.1 hypothetical protein MNAB215_2829 [Mycobacterium numidiamassiliense]